MKPFYIDALIGQAVWIPFVYCLIRWRVIKPVYVPLCLYLFARGATELWGDFMAVYKGNNAVVYNIQYLLESLLLTWQFYLLKAFTKKIFVLLEVFWVLLWLADVWLIGSFHAFNLVHHSIYSFVLLFATSSLLSKLVVSVRYNIFYNTVFWISIIFSFWFLYNILYELVEYISAHMPSFRNTSSKFTWALTGVALLVNVCLLWAIRCIPEKRAFRSL